MTIGPDYNAPTTPGQAAAIGALATRASTIVDDLCSLLEQVRPVISQVEDLETSMQLLRPHVDGPDDDVIFEAWAELVGVWMTRQLCHAISATICDAMGGPPIFDAPPTVHSMVAMAREWQQGDQWERPS